MNLALMHRAIVPYNENISLIESIEGRPLRDSDRTLHIAVLGPFLAQVRKQIAAELEKLYVIARAEHRGPRARTGLCIRSSASGLANNVGTPGPIIAPPAT